MIAGFVLAGGRSRRMGQDKALLVVDGQPLARRAAQVLSAAGCAPVRLVGSQPALLTLGIPVITDASPPDAERHPLWGVAAALAASPSPLALLCPCDLPALTADDVALLLAVGGVCVAEGQPLLCVLSREHAGYAEQLARAGAPAHRLARDLPTVPVRRDALRNANRPEDLASSAAPGAVVGQPRGEQVAVDADLLQRAVDPVV